MFALSRKHIQWALYIHVYVLNTLSGGGFLSAGKWSESCSFTSDSLWPQGLYSPWNSPGQNIGMGSCSLFQGIFPTQGLNTDQLYQLSHQGSPVQGNLHCEESARVPSTVEDSSDFLIFFRPENSKQVAVSGLLTQLILRRGQLLRWQHHKHSSFCEHCERMTSHLNLFWSEILKTMDYSVFTWDMNFLPTSGLGVLTPNCHHGIKEDDKWLL